MDVKVGINKLPCQHVVVTYMAGGKEIKRAYTLSELKSMLNIDSLDEAEQMVFAQMKKLILENPTATVSQLKTLIEGETFKV